MHIQINDQIEKENLEFLFSLVLKELREFDSGTFVILPEFTNYRNKLIQAIRYLENLINEKPHQN